MKRILVGAIAAAVLLVACGGDEPTTSTGETPERVTGTITEVEPAEGTPEHFIVQEEDGDEFTIEIDPDMDYGFDLTHLHEHQASGDPVDVDIRTEGDALIATSIVDV